MIKNGLLEVFRIGEDDKYVIFIDEKFMINLQKEEYFLYLLKPSVIQYCCDKCKVKKEELRFSFYDLRKVPGLSNSKPEFYEKYENIISFNVEPLYEIQPLAILESFMN